MSEAQQQPKGQAVEAPNEIAAPTPHPNRSAAKPMLWIALAMALVFILEFFTRP